MNIPGADRKTGVILLLVSALMFSSAGLFTKGISAGSWEIIFWRGVFASVFTTLYVLVRGRLFSDFLGMGGWGLTVAVVGASGSAAFIPAFKLTSIANVALIYAASPLVAALIAWVWMSEVMSRSAMVGCSAAIIGVSIIVSGSLDGLNVRGDLLALWMTLAMAFVIVIYRRYPKTPSTGPAVLSSLLLLPFSLWFGMPLTLPADEIFVSAGFGCVFAIAAIALTEGAKRLPAGETGLLSSSEAPFAIVLAYLVLAEIPESSSLIGGALILAGVIGSQIYTLKENRNGNSEQTQFND